MPYKDPAKAREAARRNYRNNKATWAARQKAKRDTNPTKFKEEQRRIKYGLQLGQFDAMWRAQDGKCAVCATPLRGGHGAHVDHDHASGAVRGLLCHNCNRMLGAARDNPVFLLSAVEYLNSSSTVRSRVYEVLSTP